jgi:hypothetical protein
VAHSLLVTLLLLSVRAEAHDHAPVSSDAVAAEAIEPSIGFMTAHFAIPGYRTGSYVSVLPSLRVANASGVWGMLVVPIHHLSFVGDTETGVGDVAVAAGFNAVRRGAISVDAALWTMWPTGDAHASLGSSHVMLAPEIDAQLSSGRWLGAVSVAVRGAVPWGMHGMHEHQPLVNPHDLLDLKLTARGAVRLLQLLELSAHADPVIVFIPHPVQPVGTRVSAGVGAAINLGDWRGEVGFAIPLTTARAWDWQLGAAISVRISEPGTDSKIARR